jgi:hypothetical protein
VHDPNIAMREKVGHLRELARLARERGDAAEGHAFESLTADIEQFRRESTGDVVVRDDDYALSDEALVRVISDETDRALRLSTTALEREMRKTRVEIADAILFQRLKGRVAARLSARQTGDQHQGDADRADSAAASNKKRRRGHRLNNKIRSGQQRSLPDTTERLTIRDVLPEHGSGP